MLNRLAFIQDDKNLVIYRPRWNRMTGSVNATILLLQIIYRWRGEPFYKFSRPPKRPHSDYRPGDSWQEELGMGRYEFTNARDRIAVRTERGVLDEESLVSFWVDGYRRTWYMLNEELLLEKLAEIYPIQPNPATQPRKEGLAAILDWMGFTGRMTRKDDLASPEQILAWALWTKMNESSLKKQEKNPIAIARASWRRGDWPNQALAECARREIDTILTAGDPETELNNLLREIERPSRIPDALKDIIKR